MSLKFNDDVKIKFVQLMKINTAHLKNNISNYKKCIYRLIATFFQNPFCTYLALSDTDQ